MSTDWNVHCIDCNDTHRFDDANRSDLMLSLCRHADSIAAMADLCAETSEVEIRTLWGRVDASWFRRHLGHNLTPIDEYGRLLGQCHEWITCGECTSTHKCAL